MNKSIKCLLSAVILLFVSMQTTAGIIYHEFDTELTQGGTAPNYLDLDLDNVVLSDIGLLQLDADILYVENPSGLLISDALLMSNTLVDDAVSFLIQPVRFFTFPLLNGSNFIGVKGTFKECNVACFGVIALNYDSASDKMFLTSFGYETDSSNVRTVAELSSSVAVPEPSSITLLGLALFGFALSRKKSA